MIPGQLELRLATHDTPGEPDSVEHKKGPGDLRIAGALEALAFI